MCFVHQRIIFQGEKCQNFHICLRSGWERCPPPYGQPDRKIRVFLRLPKIFDIHVLNDEVWHDLASAVYGSNTNLLWRPSTSILLSIALTINIWLDGFTSTYSNLCSRWRDPSLSPRPSGPPGNIPPAPQHFLQTATKGKFYTCCFPGKLVYSALYVSWKKNLLAQHSFEFIFVPKPLNNMGS